MDLTWLTIPIESKVTIEQLVQGILFGSVGIGLIFVVVCLILMGILIWRKK